MASATSTRWRPSQDLRRAALRALGVLLLGAWGGFFLMVLGFKTAAAIVCLPLVVLYFVLHFRAFALLETEPGLEEPERERVRSQLGLYGPLGLVVLAWRSHAAK
jgi:hypothetical protein